jgi:hypothetical protein
MPDGILPNEGIALQLSCIVRAIIFGVNEWELMLWVNDIEPDADTVLADLQEPSWSGYIRKALPRPTWTFPTVSDGCATSEYGTTPQQWTVGSTTSEMIHGYAMVDPTAGVLRFVQRLEPEEIIPLVMGQVVKLLPRYTLTSAACAGP